MLCSDPTPHAPEPRTTLALLCLPPLPPSADTRTPTSPPLPPLPPPTPEQQDLTLAIQAALLNDCPDINQEAMLAVAWGEAVILQRHLEESAAVRRLPPTSFVGARPLTYYQNQIRAALVVPCRALPHLLGPISCSRARHPALPLPPNKSPFHRSRSCSSKARAPRVVVARWRRRSRLTTCCRLRCSTRTWRWCGRCSPSRRAPPTSSWTSSSRRSSTRCALARAHAPRDARTRLAWLALRQIGPCSCLKHTLGGILAM